jgi:hypothetical protein
MAEQQNNGGDQIDRALIRAHGIAGSPLEKAIRLNAYKLIDTGDGTKTDANLDRFVLELRQDEFYSTSFTTPPVGATLTSKATVVPTEQERVAIGITGKVSGSPTPEKAKPQSQQTVQPTAEEFDEMRRSGKVAVGK